MTPPSGPRPSGPVSRTASDGSRSGPPRAAGAAPSAQRRGPGSGSPRTRPAGSRPAARPSPRPAARRGTRRLPLGRPGTRLRGGLLAVLAVLAVLGGRLVQLQGLSSTAYAQSAVEQRTVNRPLPAVRGAITDRTGQPLAMSVQGRAVQADPRAIAKADCAADAARPCTPASIAAALAPVLGLPAADLAERLGRDAGFVYLARDLEPAVGDAVKALKLVGISVVVEPSRVHPGKDLAANVIGFTDRDGKGAGGVESGFQSLLAGTDGASRAQVDAAGRVIPTGDQRLVEPVPGRDVQLTLDRDLQWYAQQQLAAKVAETGAVNGSAVVMDARTGEVLALATAPTFDADDPGASAAAQRGNPALSEVYEPGSVMKVVTAGAALESGVVTPDTVLTVPDTMQVAGRTFHDAESHPVEHLTFTGVIVKSSNVGTIQVAQRLGPERLHEALVRFGFGEKTGLGLPGESRGILADTKDWSGTSIATIPIGQGVSANAVQVASVYAIVANDGVRVTPSIVKGTVDAQGRLVPAPAPESHRVISSQVAAQLRTMLEGVVSAEGTAPLAAIPGYRTAGKTGTAQRVVDGRYVPGNYTSSFTGFVPADAPRLVTAVVLQGSGAKGYFGGAVAGPVFKDVMSFALRELQVPPTDTQVPVLRLSAD